MTPRSRARAGELEAASAYLDVAPTVVRVRATPTCARRPGPAPEVADPVLLDRLGEAYGVANPVGRVLKALGLG